MHRVELKEEEWHGLVKTVFSLLMHRVELKEEEWHGLVKTVFSLLMHRVELKGLSVSLKV